MVKTIGIMTGGGHISSFHAGMYGILSEAEKYHYKVIGFLDGYKGVKEGHYIPLKIEDIDLNVAGSCIGCSREKADERVARTMKEKGVDALIVMGGNDSLDEAFKLYQDGVNVVGWPKTMDNDVSGTRFCLGYPTAAMKGAEMIRQFHNNAITNSRIHIVTLFGRDTDWIVATAGMWGCADVVVPAEHEYPMDYIVNAAHSAYNSNMDQYGKPFAIVAVAEGAKIKGFEKTLTSNEIDAYGHHKLDPIKLSCVLKDEFKKYKIQKISNDSISYILRDCPPINIDIEFAYNAGKMCVYLINNGIFGKSVTLNNTKDVKYRISRDVLSVVKERRPMAPEGFFDYDKLRPTKNLEEYYEVLFGKPVQKDELVYRTLKHLP